MTRQALVRLLRRSLPSSLARDENGVAAIEFGFIAPIMLLLLLGCVAVTMGVCTDRRVTQLTQTIGNIVGQYTNLANADATNIFNAGTAVMAPYNASPTILSMRVSSVKINSAGTKACIRWSRSPNGGYQRNAGDDVTSLIPADLRIANTYLVWPEVQYVYTPVIGSSITGGSITLSDQLFMRPRQSDEVTTDGQDLAKCP